MWAGAVDVDGDIGHSCTVLAVCGAEVCQTLKHHITLKIFSKANSASLLAAVKDIVDAARHFFLMNV